MKKNIYKFSFYIRFYIYNKLRSKIRVFYYSFLGMKIGKGTILTKLYVTWPHKVFIGHNCILEHNVYLKFDGVWQDGHSILIHNNVFIGSGCEFNIRQSIVIGSNTLIASGCKFIDHDHGLGTNQLIRVQSGIEKPIIIGENVWLGFNVIILKGVQVGEGAVVAAGSVVTKSIPPGEIWAGIPAQKIGLRGI